MHKSFAKEIARRKFERTDDGELYLPASKILLGGVFGHWINDDMSTYQEDHNLVVDEGLEYAIGAALMETTQPTDWYIGAFKSNYTVLATNTAASREGDGMTEVVATTDVSNTSRPVWTGVQAAKVVTNAASPAVYTANAATDVYGAFLISDSTMAGTAGTLFAASQFAAAPRSLGVSDQINITYQITVADA